MDEHFYLKVIPVEGAVSIAAADIVQASALASNHVFAADPDLAAARIAELPGVIAAKVTLRWPNRLLIQVQEDSPKAMWQEGGQQFWITNSGQLIPVGSSTSGLLLIESEMPVAVSEELDDTTTAKPQASLAFISKDVLTGALLLGDLLPELEKLYYRPSSGLSYEDGRGWRVYLGTGNDMKQKLVTHEAIAAELLANGLTPSYISVSNQEKPYYMAR
jgi:hypothetical protein